MKKEDMKRIISERTKRFKIVEGVVLLAVVVLLFGGIVYYSEADRLQFNRVLNEVQRQVAQSSNPGKARLGAPEGIVPIFQDMLTGQETVELGMEHPAGDARREGCEFFVTEREVPGQELKDTGYQLLTKKGEYYLYGSLMEEGDWQITQYGTVSGLQSMCYTLVSEDGKFILLDGGHNVDLDNLKRLISVFGGQVDLWICSHFHEDHIGAITELLAQQAEGRDNGTDSHDEASPVILPEGILIKEIWCPQMDIDTYKTFAKDWDSIDTCEKFLQEISGLECVTRIQNGDSRTVGNLDFYFFSSYTEGAPWTHEGNNCGLIFKVQGKSETMLFCCDIGNEWISERLINGHGDRLKADYVQMGHHGNGGLTEEAYRIVAPKAAFFDCPEWIFADEEKYTATKNRKLMESLGCKIYLLDEAPNSILLK